MDGFFKNKYIQAALVFLSILGLAYIYQHVTYDPEAGQTVDPVPEVVDTMENMADMPATESGDASVDYAGTHIMPDGSVMTGAGAVIEGAVILDNGDIEMPNGTTITPVGDFR